MRGVLLGLLLSFFKAHTSVLHNPASRLINLGVHVSFASQGNHAQSGSCRTLKGQYGQNNWMMAVWLSTTSTLRNSTVEEGAKFV